MQRKAAAFVSRGRAHARESQPRIKAVACRQGRAVGDRSADPVCAQRADAHRRSDRRDRRDNQLAITGSGWDPELLRLELGEIKLAGFDLSLTGFGDLELKDIMADRTAGLTDPDDTPAVPEHPVSRTGDLWLLGAKVTCPKCHNATPLERAIRK